MSFANIGVVRIGKSIVLHRQKYKVKFRIMRMGERERERDNVEKCQMEVKEFIYIFTTTICKENENGKIICQSKSEGI